MPTLSLRLQLQQYGMCIVSGGSRTYPSATCVLHVVQASSTNGAGGSAQLRLVATVTQAGSYALSVAVTDPATKAVRRIPTRGSPDTVMVRGLLILVDCCKVPSMHSLMLAKGSKRKHCHQPGGPWHF